MRKEKRNWKQKCEAHFKASVSPQSKSQLFNYNYLNTAEKNKFASQ